MFKLVPDVGQTLHVGFRNNIGVGAGAEAAGMGLGGEGAEAVVARVALPRKLPPQLGHLDEHYRFCRKKSTAWKCGVRSTPPLCEE